VLLTAVTEEALNGDAGVLAGLDVIVGETREKGVFVSSGVNVGRGVSPGVTSRVGLLRTGGNILNDELGLTRINRKYKLMPTVITSTRIESLSHIPKDAFCEDAFCFPSKSKFSSIQFTPVRGARLKNSNNFCH